MSTTETLPPAASPTERWLKIAVVGMGLMILFGLAVVVARIVYLANRGPTTASTTVSSALAEQARVFLPAGAVMRQLALSGDRLAIGYEGAGGTGVLVLDLGSGRVLSRVGVVPEPPSR